MTIAWLIVAAALAPALAEDGALPPEAREFLKKLQAFEDERMAETSKEISEKRKHVITFLTGLQKTVTTKGDLEGALAIKA